MQELIAQAHEEIRSASRFRWYGMLLAWLICAGGWVWVAIQPDIFEANARVYVDTSSILQPVLGNRIITPNVTTQLAYIREALLGREQMVAVARDTGLDSTASTTAQYEAVISSLQNAIQIRSTGGPRNSPDGVYSISYRNSERGHAISVVSAVLDNFVETTIGANQQQGDTAERFLDERVDEYEARLARAEQARAEFVKENSERLPGTQGSYFTRLQSERDALDKVRRDLAILQSRRDELSAQLRGERSVISSTGAGLEPAPNSLDARIRDSERRLDELLLEYTERHPDVIATRNMLERLKAQRTDQLSELGIDGEGGEQELGNLESNPVYQALQMNINDADVEIATLQADIALRQQRIEELQSLIDEVPEVEAQLARLNRDYEVIYEQYLALVRSRETQELTRKATDTDQIDFRVIDPPLAPLTPVAPDRIMMLAAVFGAAIAAGAALCYLLAQIRPVFGSPAALRQLTGLPVLGAVSYAWPERFRARRWWSLAAYVAASICLFAAFGALAGIEVAGSGLRSLIG